MTRPLNVLPFAGIHPDTLGHYLSGLGLLAAVGQKWPDVRGCWRDRRFVLLHESLTEEQVRQHLLTTWDPTPYERWWDKAQSADTKAKGSAAVRQLRNDRPVREVRVLEAHLVGAGRNQFNPIFGDGGVMGQRKFAAAHAACLDAARPKIKAPKSKPPKATGPTKPKPPTPAQLRDQLKREGWLSAALAGADDVELPRVPSAGAWFVFANKTFNTGQTWSREGQLSPWSYLLAVEGAFLLVGDVNRRLGSKARPYAVFPFVCDPAQPAAAGEVGMLRGEFWAPLWGGPATLAEVRHLLRRGQARVGTKSAHAPAEFAVAALGAGADAGVAEFVRFELRHTTTTDYCREAIPREHVAVGREPAAARLLTEIVGWLAALRRHDDNRERQFRGYCGPVEAAVIRVSEAAGSPTEPERWRELLLELARQQARIDRNAGVRESLPPVPRLGAGWFERAWPKGSCGDEIAVARAFASVGADTTYPLLLNVFGVELQGRYVKFAGKARPPGAVWNDGEPTRVLTQVLQRRLVDGPQLSRLPDGRPDYRFLTGTCPAPWSAVARLLAGDLDFGLVADWTPALSLIDWRSESTPTGPRGDTPTGAALLLNLLRPVFHYDPKRVLRWLPSDADWPPRPAFARRILNLIQAGNFDEACRAAKSHYQAAGRRVVDVPVDLSGDADLPTRLAAALLIPAADRDIQEGLARWLFPEKFTTA